MTDKERLEVINRTVTGIYDTDTEKITGVHLQIDDCDWLIKQAERVKELERANKQLKNNLSVYKGYYNTTLRHNKELVEHVQELEDLIKKTKEGLRLERNFLYHVTFPESSEVEGRRFYKGNEYPVYKKDDKYVILYAENGDFCFSNELMKRAIKEWDLTIY